MNISNIWLISLDHVACHTTVYMIGGMTSPCQKVTKISTFYPWIDSSGLISRNSSKQNQKLTHGLTDWGILGDTHHLTGSAPSTAGVRSTGKRKDRSTSFWRWVSPRMPETVNPWINFWFWWISTYLWVPFIYVNVSILIFIYVFDLR